MQDWWRDQAPATGVTVRDDMRQEVFPSVPVHLGALDETLTWCGEAAEAADTRIDVELTVQDSTLHVWLGLDKVDVRAACDDFARLLSHTLPYTDCLVGDDQYCCACTAISRRLPSIPWPTAGMDAYLSGPLDRRRPSEEVADGPMRSTGRPAVFVSPLLRAAPIDPLGCGKQTTRTMLTSC